MSLTTLDQALFGERGFSTRLDQYIDGRGKLKGEALEEALSKSHQVKVSFRVVGDAKYEEVCKKQIKSGFNPHLVTEMVRDAIEEEFGNNPKGEVKIIVYPSGMSGSPPVRVFREVVSVALSSDPEVDFLKQRLSEERSDNREMRQNVTSILLGQQSLIGTIVSEVRHLAVTRTASSSIADGGGGAMGLLTMAIGFPMMKRLMGLRKDATLEDVADRFGMLAQESMKSPPGITAATLTEAEGSAGWDEAEPKAEATNVSEGEDPEVPQLTGPTASGTETPGEITDEHLLMILKLGDNLSDETVKQSLVKRVFALAQQYDLTIPDFMVKMAAT